MNIKGIITTLLLGLMATTYSFSQEEVRSYDEENCAKYRSLYFQYLKQGAYRDAMNFWGMAYDYCGGVDSLDAKFFSNARVAYGKMIKEEKGKKEAADPVLVQNYQDTLYWIYETRMLIEDDPKWTADYASMLVTDKDPRFGKIDTLWANSIHRLKDKASYRHIKQYFRHLIINNYNNAPVEEKDGIRTFIIEEYMILSDYCATAIENGDEKSDERYANAQAFLDKYFGKIVNDCTVLSGVLDAKLDDLPENKEDKIATVKKYLGLMEQKKCTTDSTYAKYVDVLVELEPSADAFYFQGSVAMTNEDYKKAVASFEKALEMEADGENADKYRYNLANAQYANHQYKAAFRTAKGVTSEEYKGKALVICGNSIAATANGCGSTTFERKANYWLANDYYQKAKAAGAEVSGGKYLSSAPTVQDCFDEGVTSGSSFTLSCWGESTTVRPQ